ncbi:MAG: hypothetical protein N3B16_05385 [Candidatus Aminicenantes bacterium]|nr:hypothetical protein [Candidatus Aminicenantes bacterium]
MTWQKSQVSRLETKLEAQKKSLEKAKEAKDKSEQQWLFWSEASHQLKELKTKWFYRAEEGMRQIRIDLDEIFREARLSLPVLQYNYQDLEKGKIRKVSFNLRLKTSYLALRELIARLESFPRFLLLEDIDFPNIIEADSNLDLRLVISAYYVYQ